MTPDDEFDSLLARLKATRTMVSSALAGRPLLKTIDPIFLVTEIWIKSVKGLRMVVHKHGNRETIAEVDGVADGMIPIMRQYVSALEELAIQYRNETDAADAQKEEV